jgi:rhodanese-related sulfurtransferase
MNAPDIRPNNPVFFDIRYPAEYQIALPDILYTGCPAGYPANVKLIQ